MVGCDQSSELVQEGLVRHDAVKTEALAAVGDDLRGVGWVAGEQHERAVKQLFGGDRGEGLGESPRRGRRLLADHDRLQQRVGAVGPTSGVTAHVSDPRVGLLRGRDRERARGRPAGRQ